MWPSWRRQQKGYINLIFLREHCKRLKIKLLITSQMHGEQELVFWRSNATKTLVVFTMMCSVVTVVLFLERTSEWNCFVKHIFNLISLQDYLERVMLRNELKKNASQFGELEHMSLHDQLLLSRSRSKLTNSFAGYSFSVVGKNESANLETHCCN